MKLWKEYILAQSVDEALAALSNAQGPACPIGGGTDLLLEMQQGRRTPLHTLVDITQIPELCCLEERAGSLFIGAGVSVSRIVEDPQVQRHALAVSEACRLIGGPQVRNTATLGGNVAHALPAADGMIALVAMDAQAEIASPEGHRQVPILSLFKGPGESTLEKRREILAGFYLPLRNTGEGSAFNRVMRPQGVALPILNMAVWMRRHDDRIADVRVAVGPAGPVPARACAVEDYLRGQIYSPALIDQAVETMKQTMKFRTSARRASAEYRYHLGGVLLQDVFAAAWERTYGLEAI